MRVLYVNWVDYLDAWKRGGGVSVYQSNLLSAFVRNHLADAVFLSSGTAHSSRKTGPYWRKLPSEEGDHGVARFEIVNSGVLAPGHSSFSNRSQISDAPTTEAIFDFIETNGPFDVVHFNNLEGVPAETLKLKDRWPDTRVVMSLHNYYPFCAQVNLWAEERENCVHFDDGRGCIMCDPRLRENSIRVDATIDFELARLGIKPPGKAFIAAKSVILKGGIQTKRQLRRLTGLVKPKQLSELAKLTSATAPQQLKPDASSGYHKERRETFVRLLNEHCDAVLGVSRRVCEIAEHHGVNPAILRTSYIGTAHSELWDKSPVRDRILAEDGTLTLAYLGYMRRDKGFFFLTHALRALPADLARRIHLRVFARGKREYDLRQLRLLGDHLSSVQYQNGYVHDQLDSLLDGVNVGLVPVLWEDNLPQVAIEMHARRIPLLTSNLGGAQELGNFPQMVFKAGSVEEFTDRLTAILNEEVSAQDYWQNAMRPKTNAEHMQELLEIYQDGPAGA